MIDVIGAKTLNICFLPVNSTTHEEKRDNVSSGFIPRMQDWFNIRK
jgi:hypothetical protein